MVINSKMLTNLCGTPLQSLLGLVSLEGTKPPSDIPYKVLACLC